MGRIHIITLRILLLTGIALSAFTGAETAASCDGYIQYTFSWQFIDQCDLKPRGGTSKGAELKLDPNPSPGWLSIQDNEISKQERDRRAILAMAGPYRATFDFLEVVGYKTQFEPDPPYQSWGTEYIYVVADEKDFVSLQHIMVMYYENEKGEIIGPVVQKHWRQDWQYQQQDLLVYTGENQWSHKTFDASEVAGTWTQSVYQVDDSPRYSAKGKWEHFANVSTWLSDETWRPLPRRESSFRKDYDVLIGTNRHTITPNGWVHEEENYKVVLDDNGGLSMDEPILSKELGVNRYQRLLDFDFTAGDKYWRETGEYWRDVRRAWEQLAGLNKPLLVHKSIDGVPLFMPFFEYAERIFQTHAYDSDAGQIAIDNILNNYVQALDNNTQPSSSAK